MPEPSRERSRPSTIVPESRAETGRPPHGPDRARGVAPRARARARKKIAPAANGKYFNFYARVAFGFVSLYLQRHGPRHTGAPPGKESLIGVRKRKLLRVSA